MTRKVDLHRRMRSLLLIVVCFSFSTLANGAELPSLTSDFAYRDSLPESNTPASDWYGNKRLGSWGPHPSQYPHVDVPAGCDPVEWQRARIIAVAKKYIGLPYQHHHIPAWSPEEGPGLDCSNFTSWVYNYGLGIKFISDVHKQASGPSAPGRLLGKDEKFVPGDLLYILKADRSVVSHVAIFIDEGHVIDCHKVNVNVRDFEGWYKTNLSHARRVIE
jgi:NlpC/P60 family